MEGFTRLREFLRLHVVTRLRVHVQSRPHFFRYGPRGQQEGKRRRFLLCGVHPQMDQKGNRVSSSRSCTQLGILRPFGISEF